MKILFAFVLYMDILKEQCVEPSLSTSSRMVNLRYPVYSNIVEVRSTLECWRACVENVNCAAVNLRTADVTCQQVTSTNMDVNVTNAPGWNVYRVTCVTGWTYFDGFCYYPEHDQLSWDDAVVRCNQIHATAWLADIRSVKEQQFMEGFLVTHFPSADVVFLGGRADGPGGDWVWRDGATLDSGYVNWGENQPQPNYEDCAAIFPMDACEVHDVDCGDLEPSICKYRFR